MEKLVITAALTGSLGMKEKTPHVPITPDEIAADALKCYKAGAAIVHVHARDPITQKSVHTAEIFDEISKKIKKLCPELIVQISTGGRAGLSLESRLEAVQINPEMASFTTGSINFPDHIYINSPELIERLAIEMQKRDIKPEVEIFDTGMIPTAMELCERGILKGPLYFNFIMGMKNIQPTNFNQLTLLLNSIPKESPWNISGIGKHQLYTTYLGICLGGNVRVGLEDNLYYSRGVLASNEQLVARAARLSREYGRDVATPEEARKILGM
ncbi:3-keto-5-aminohexanoate cleavage enzyme [Dethiosulfatibacter aminovorans DSM 17477]|uniref:3-keto-5-aminohexanoate cleavage enzyme n=1 Tax=Dethiosulfatibacter aminovorans DSM 17477 TaxID=1121476 RepID=A0A1M6MZM5_9FIRM|nr:3-keto-5-aminohexanoate cleavage protein [Dethiosulfatibacter aminovorans]SHJ88783.1 3-keto-5-aminohexanoate cleavage enzyme [Dethiosulfatibacter aminovorans DSM 17477]